MKQKQPDNQDMEFFRAQINWSLNQAKKTSKKMMPPNDFYRQVGMVIHLGRTHKKWSQKELGEQLGISFQQVQNMNRANRICPSIVCIKSV